MKLPFLVIFLSLLSATIGAFSQTLYVAPAGNDQYPGTADQPLATLTGARDRLRLLRQQNQLVQPVQVVVRQGEYWMKEPLVLSLQDSGTETAPIIFKGETGVMPVFYGGMSLKKFEKVSDALWKTDVPEVRQYGWYFEQLYINGTRAIRAQAPNDGFYQPRSVKEFVMQKDTLQTIGLSVQKVTIPQESTGWFEKLSEPELNDAIVTFYHNWDNTRKPVKSFSRTDTAIYVVGQAMKPWNKIDSKSLFVIENVAAALDAPGEWFLERSGTLYYRPRPGETIEQVTAIAPVNEKFIVVAGDEKSGKRVAHIRFENLSFRVAGYRMPAAGIEPEQAAASNEATVQLDFTDRIDFVNCEITQTGGSAIWFRRACSNGHVERCYLHDVGASGVKIGETTIRSNPQELTHHITVDNNIIRSGGHVFPCAVAIPIFHGSDNVLSHNEIADFRYSGVSVGWVWGYAPSPSKRNRIEFNHIHHLGWGVLSDMGGVYTLGKSEGTVVRNNVIHHVYAFDYGGWGLYTDEGSTGIVMENNLVYACKSSGFHQHYGEDNLVSNNIFADNLRAQLQATRVEPHRSFTFTHNIVYYHSGTLLSNNWDRITITDRQNCYWDTRTNDIRFGKSTFKQWQQAGKDAHSIIADPGFVDPSAFDFRFKNQQVIRKIGFKPFDYTQAGVYGSPDWKNQARFDPALAQEFDRVVEQHEQESLPGKP